MPIEGGVGHYNESADNLVLTQTGMNGTVLTSECIDAIFNGWVGNTKFGHLKRVCRS